MTILLGGRPVTTMPTPPQSGGLATHDAYGLWDSYIGMIASRTLAVQLWQRLQSLEQKMDANKEHSNYQTALSRWESIGSKLREQETTFLTNERNADGYWKRMPLAEKVEESFDAMFSLLPQHPTLIGMWWHPLGIAPIPDREQRISSTALAFAVPSQQKEYR